MLEGDPASRVACETLLTTGLVVVAGEVTTSTYVDIPALVRDTVCDIGYDNDAYGFNGKTLRRARLARRAVARHRPGCRRLPRAAQRQRRRGRPQRPRRGRPGHDVRLRLRRDARPHAAPDLALAPPLASAWPRCAGPARCPTCAPTARPRSRSSTRTGARSRIDTVLISTQHAAGHRPRGAAAPDLREHVINPLLPTDLDTEDLRIFVNPTGHLRAGWAARRHRSDRSQDHRRHLRRHGPPRRWRLLGQGPVEGGPLGGLRGALGRQARRGGRCRQALRDPGRLRHRRRPARLARSSRRSAPRRSTRRRSPMRCARSSTSALPPSSATSTCAARSTRRRRPTATSDARRRSSRGRPPPGGRPAVRARALIA